MKKILSLILAGLMTLSCAAFVAADEAEAEVTAEAEVVVEKTAAELAQDYALEFLANKSIWKGVSAEELVADAESNVERWHMALLVSRISTGWLDDAEWEDGTANDSTFTDLEGTTAEKYLGAISYANQNGIIEGYSADKFGPEDFITYRDGLTMAVRTLGYKGLSYPWGYIEKAVELGLTEDIDKAYTADLTRGEVAVILYNALFATTKSGETLAKSIFDVEFGWENIVIVGNRYGYTEKYSDVCAKCPDGYVAFKILSDDNDATLSSATYYVKGTELGLASTKFNEEQTLIGKAYLALFEVAENGIVNMVEAHDLKMETIWNWAGSKDVKYALMKYQLVEKFYDVPYISEADKPELMLYAQDVAQTFVVDKTKVTIDVTTLNIYKDGKIEWWYDQVNNRYFKVIWNADSQQISVDFMDETIFEEWYAEAVKVAAGNSSAYSIVTKATIDANTDNLFLDSPYAKLELYDIDNDGVAERALYKRYRIGQVAMYDEAWWGEAGVALIINCLDNDDSRDAFTVSGVGTGGDGKMWIGATGTDNLDNWTLVLDESVTQFSTPAEMKTYYDTVYARRGVTETDYDSSWQRYRAKKGIVMLYNADNNSRVLEILRVFDHTSEDENNGIFTGMLKGYTLTEKGVAKINLDGRVLDLGYKGLDGIAIGDTRTSLWGVDYFTAYGYALAKALNEHLYKQIEVTVVDGKVVDIDKAHNASADDAIFVMGYAGITSDDNMIAVYGYSLADINNMKTGDEKLLKIFKINTINGWAKGDYQYYPINALTDAAFQPGTIYDISRYNEADNSYDVDVITVDDLKVGARPVNSVTFEGNYRLWDGYQWDYEYPKGQANVWSWFNGKDTEPMTASDKYLIIKNDGTLSVHVGIVENSEWYIKDALYFPMFWDAPLTSTQAEKQLTNVLHVFFESEEKESEFYGFDSIAYNRDLVLYTNDSYIFGSNYDADITDDALLGAGNYLKGSVQTSRIEAFNLMNGQYEIFTAANNLKFEVGKVYVALDGIIMNEYCGPEVGRDLLATANKWFWNSSEDPLNNWSYDGNRYLIFDGVNDDALLLLDQGFDANDVDYYPGEEDMNGWVFDTLRFVFFGYDKLKEWDYFQWYFFKSNHYWKDGDAVYSLNYNAETGKATLTAADTSAWDAPHEVVMIFDTQSGRKIVYDLGVKGAKVTSNVAEQEFKATVATEFTVTLTANNYAGKDVYGKLEFLNGTTSELTSLEFYDGANWVAFDAEGQFGEPYFTLPAGATTLKFRATFAAAGTAKIAATLYSEDTDQVLDGFMTDLTIGAAPEPDPDPVAATIASDIAAQEWKKDVSTQFTVTLTANDDAGKVVYGAWEYVTGSIEATAASIKMGLNDWDTVAGTQLNAAPLAEGETVLTLRGYFAEAGEVAVKFVMYAQDGTKIAETEVIYFEVK